MADKGARPAIIAGYVKPLARNLWQFVRRPTPSAFRLTLGRDFVNVFALLLTVQFVLALGSLGLLLGLVAAGVPLPEPAEDEMSFSQLFILAVIIAPVWEECAFRGWLSGELRSVAFAALGLALLGWLIVSSYGPGADPSGESGLEALRFVLVLTLGGAVIWWFAPEPWRQVPDWFANNFAAAVWLSSIAFGLMHILDFKGVTNIAHAIVVLPQTLGGLVLAYTRTRLGLRAAIAQHAAYNALVIALFG
ncbi:MAG: CPBP family glutamic-type intramembrane protease [Pseudomonadota bacterium]